MRMLNLPRLTNKRRVSWFKNFNWGKANLLPVGTWDHSPINHSTSCLQIRPGPAGDKVISLICSFIHFCCAPQTSSKLIWKLLFQPEIQERARIGMGSNGFQIDIPMWISCESASKYWIPFLKTCSKLILIDASPRQRPEKAREQAECRRVR